MSRFMLAPNGEVEGPRDHAGRAPRAHTVPRRPRRTTKGASRPPPTIVRSRPASPNQNVGHDAINKNAEEQARYVHHKVERRPLATEDISYLQHWAWGQALEQGVGPENYVRNTCAARDQHGGNHCGYKR